MTIDQLATERLIFIALLKAISEQGTYLTGELKLKIKQDFNILIKQSDRFVSDVEKNLNDSQKEYLQSITDIYHNMNIEIRTNLNNKKFINSSKDVKSLPHTENIPSANQHVTQV